VRETLIIEPGSSSKTYWRDLWRYRELFYFLAWRDILVRYKQTIIGMAWSIIRPLATMVVFTIVFGKLAKMPSDGVPYPILVFAGLLPWQLFASAVTEASNSLVGNAAMLSKVYFPRLIVPTSAVVVAFVDFLISFGILIVLMMWYQFVPDWRLLTMPLFVLLALMTALGLGMWMGALNVKYRDFRYIVPFMVQLGLYISPVGFSTSVIPDNWRLVYSLNPMVGIIDGFRWATLSGSFQLYVPGLMVSTLVVAFVFWYGLTYFRKNERVFADVI
jgi:homopolymeric O-antigen transport system permease protein